MQQLGRWNAPTLVAFLRDKPHLLFAVGERSCWLPEVKMELLNFAEYARRRSARLSSAGLAAATISAEDAAAPVTDRWAMLHTQGEEPVVTTPDFWADLQLRVAYPTLYMRHH